MRSGTGLRISKDVQTKRKASPMEPVLVQQQEKLHQDQLLRDTADPCVDQLGKVPEGPRIRLRPWQLGGSGVPGCNLEEGECLDT